MALLVTALFHGAGVAQEGVPKKAGKAAEQPPEEGKIAGLVVDSMLEPIPNAVVEARDGSYKTLGQTRTDLAGRFILSGLPLEYVWVRGTAEGYDWGWQSQRPSPIPGQPSRVEVRCFDAATITGIVKDAAGKPVVGAEVTGSFDGSMQHDAKWNEYAETVTDKAGKFQLIKVPLGDVRVRVSAEGFEFHESALYLTKNTSTALTLKPGAGRKVRVVVEGVPSNKLASVTCTIDFLNDRDLAMPRRLRSGRFDQDGIWVIRGLPERVRWLRFAVRCRGVTFESAHTTLTRDGSTDEKDGQAKPADAEERVVFKVKPVAKKGAPAGTAPEAKKVGGKTEAFRGVLVTKAGKPLSEAHIRLWSSSIGSRRTVSAVDGSFAVVGPFEPNEEVSLELSSSEWVLAPDRALRVGGYTFWRVQRRYHPAKIHKLRVLRGATVSGVVLNPQGKPSANSWVRLEHDQTDHRRWVGGASTNAKGEFEIGGLQDLTGKLYLVVNDVEGFGEKGPLRCRGKRVLEGQKIKLARPTIVEGSVIGPGRKPVVGARVSIVARDVGQRVVWDSPAQALTNRDGKFRYRGLKPDSYAIKIFVRGDEPTGKPTVFKLGKSRKIKRRIRLRKL